MSSNRDTGAPTEPGWYWYCEHGDWRPINVSRFTPGDPLRGAWGAPVDKHTGKWGPRIPMPEEGPSIPAITVRAYLTAELVRRKLRAEAELRALVAPNYSEIPNSSTPLGDRTWAGGKVIAPTPEPAGGGS